MAENTTNDVMGTFYQTRLNLVWRSEKSEVNHKIDPSVESTLWIDFLIGGADFGQIPGLESLEIVGLIATTFERLRLPVEFSFERGGQVEKDAEKTIMATEPVTASGNSSISRRTGVSPLFRPR